MWRRIPERYRMAGSLCENCRQNFFPRRTFCPICRRKGKIVDKQMSGKGKVFAYSLVTAPPVGYEGEIPYILAIIELDEGPKVTAQIVDCKCDKLEIGTKVKSAFRRITEDGDEGIIYYGFKFKLDK
ncbi:Uncharacterised protein [Candidatus Gugararchaeum adminiculabundum]|nr:Uncharacterised protein [Candidatus Gugararchaeum adminiculabundum]